MKMFFKYLLYDIIFILSFIIIYELGFINILFMYFCIGFSAGSTSMLFVNERRLNKMDKELYTQCLYKKVNDDVLKGLINNIGDKIK